MYVLPVALLALSLFPQLNSAERSATTNRRVKTRKFTKSPKTGKKKPHMPTSTPIPSPGDPLFYYDPSTSAHQRKTNSYMAFMPALDGYVQTHNTYRFITVREQVLSLIGESKYGLWRIHDNRLVRLYRKFGAIGVQVGADINNLSIQDIIMRDYKYVLVPGLETNDTGEWTGYHYSQDADGDGQASFVDLPIYHPYFSNSYDDHPAIDLPHWFCIISGANFTDAKVVWDYAKE